MYAHTRSTHSVRIYCVGQTLDTCLPFIRWTVSRRGSVRETAAATRILLYDSSPRAVSRLIKTFVIGVCAYYLLVTASDSCRSLWIPRRARVQTPPETHCTRLVIEIIIVIIIIMIIVNDNNHNKNVLINLNNSYIIININNNNHNNSYSHNNYALHLSHTTCVLQYFVQLFSWLQ